MLVVSRLVLTTSALALFASCTLIDRPIDDRDLNKLLEDYKVRTEAANTAARAESEGGIRSLTLNGTSLQSAVSVDLERAMLSTVVLRILDRAHLAYLLKNVALRGSVTARFSDVPVIDALNLLLSTRGVAAHLRSGVIVIENGEPEPAMIPHAVPGTESAPGIKTLRVESSDGQQRVTIDVQNAPLSDVIDRLLTGSRSDFVLESGPLSGSVTARFDRVPLRRAIDLLLVAGGYQATIRDGVFIISGKPAPQPFSQSQADSKPSPSQHAQKSADDGDNSGNGPTQSPQGVPYPGRFPMTPPQTSSSDIPLSVEVPLQWIDTETAATILGGIFPSSPSTNGPPPAVQYGVQPNANTVFLVGEAGAVNRTRALLQQADRESPHIMIEALVVEFDHNALERLETDIANGAFRSFSGIAANFGDLLRNGLTFTRTAGAHNATAFSLLVDYLTAQDKARLVSRPYIATYSGEQAVINITSNRYVIVQTAQQGATVTSASPVASGVTLTITPTATTDGLIRTVLQVTDSQFVPTPQNISVEVDQNQANTTMVVEDGQSIIIGGLILDRRANANSGVPGLRKIPLLNLLFANQSASRNQQEVFVVLTPHIWRPGMSMPLLDPTAFTPSLTAQ